jgi:hypothetical protein
MFGSVEVIAGGIRENGEVVGSEKLELLKSWWGHNALSKKVDATSKFG